MSNASQDLANRDYEVKIGQYFSRGWDIFKQYALPFVGFLILTFIIAVVATKLPYPLGADAKGRTGIVNPILSPIFTAGFYIVAFKIAKGRTPSFGDFFAGFNNFIQLFLTNFVSAILIALGLILFIIPGLYLAIAYMFSMPFVVDKHLDFWSALETSRKLITRNWFSFLGLALLLLLLNLGGVLLFGVGVLVTIPWTFCTIAAAYEDIVGLNGSADAM